MKNILAVLCAAALVIPAAAQEFKPIGSWGVKSEKDPFDIRKSTYALMVDRGHGLAIRCLSDGLSALLFMDMNESKEYEADATIPYKYRGGDGDIKEYSAVNFNGKGLLLANAEDILRDALASKDLSFRAETVRGLVATVTFKPRGSVKALAQIVADCDVGSEKPAAR